MILIACIFLLLYSVYALLKSNNNKFKNESGKITSRCLQKYHRKAVNRTAHVPPQKETSLNGSKETQISPKRNKALGLSHSSRIKP